MKKDTHLSCSATVLKKNKKGELGKRKVFDGRTVESQLRTKGTQWGDGWKPSLHKHTLTIAIRETHQTAQHSLEITTRRLVSSGASLLRNMGFNYESDS